MSAARAVARRREQPMIVVSDYRGHRIEINAVAVDGRFNTEVRIHGHVINAKPHVDGR